MADHRRRTLQRLIRSRIDKQDFVEFYQQVRVLERHLLAHADESNRPLRPIGQNAINENSAIEFRVDTVNRTRPATVRPISSLPEPKSEPPIEVTTTFLSLFGSAGILPQDYTSLILERVRAGDTALRDYLDVFQQRLTELSYQIWERSHPEIAWERLQATPPALRQPKDYNRFDSMLRSLAGIVDQRDTERTQQAQLYFSGLFSDTRRPALSLESILTKTFRVPVSVHQFHPRTVMLQKEVRWRLPRDRSQSEGSPRLGQGLIAGRKVCIVQTRLLVRIGPLDYHQFRSFLPQNRLDGGESTASAPSSRSDNNYEPLRELVRSYIGLECELEIELSLDPRQTPDFRPGSHQKNRLGWNTWLGGSKSKAPSQDVRFLVRD